MLTKIRKQNTQADTQEKITRDICMKICKQNVQVECASRMYEQNVQATLQCKPREFHKSRECHQNRKEIIAPK